jgi:hypothetical protein
MKTNNYQVYDRLHSNGDHRISVYDYRNKPGVPEGLDFYIEHEGSEWVSPMSLEDIEEFIEILREAMEVYKNLI